MKFRNREKRDSVVVSARTAQKKGGPSRRQGKTVRVDIYFNLEVKIDNKLVYFKIGTVHWHQSRRLAAVPL